MSRPQKIATASCSSGSVELEAIGAPVASVVCYCDDCQEGYRQIEALPNAGAVRDPDGGTSYVLYRKDRVQCSRGSHLLQRHKIKEKSATHRQFATCCNSAMFMAFDDARHWIPVYRAQLQGDVSALQMRICTKFAPGRSHISNDVPSCPSYPLKYMEKLVAAWISMLFRGQNTP